MNIGQKPNATPTPTFTICSISNSMTLQTGHLNNFTILSRKIFLSFLISKVIDQKMIFLLFLLNAESIIKVLCVLKVGGIELVV